MGERKKRIGGTGMKWYAIGKTLTPLDRAPESGAAVVLLNSDELAHETALPGLEAVLHHTPSARDAHVCKAEVRSNCLSGTLALPRGCRDGTRLCCGYLVTKDRVVLVDDGEMAEPYLKHIVKEKRLIENSVGRFLYDFFELLIARDLHRGDRRPRDGAGRTRARGRAGGIQHPDERAAQGDDGLVPLLLPARRRGVRAAGK